MSSAIIQKKVWLVLIESLVKFDNSGVPLEPFMLNNDAQMYEKALIADAS